jgi:hypothetical protein
MEQNSSPLPAGLSAEEAALISFERRLTYWPGRRDQAIRARFGLTATAYYQKLNRLIGEPAAWAFDPATMELLRRRRELKLVG